MSGDDYQQLCGAVLAMTLLSWPSFAPVWPTTMVTDKDFGAPMGTWPCIEKSERAPFSNHFPRCTGVSWLQTNHSLYSRGRSKLHAASF